MSKNLLVRFNPEEWKENVDYANRVDKPLASLIVELLREARSRRERVQNAD